MKKILVPTDFSDNAYKALLYAAELAAIVDAELIILNCWTAPYLNDSKSTEKVIEQKVKRDLEELKRRILLLPKKLNINCSILTKKGKPGETIAQAVETTMADLVIMGTKGASGLKELFMGSVTSEVIEKSTCPVLAIPLDYIPKKIEKILYASKMEEDDTKNISYISSLAAPFNAVVTVLHILPPGKEIFDKVNNFINTVCTEVKYEKLSFKLHQGEEIVENIWKVLEDEKPDILSMATHKRGFFQGLINESLTRKIVFHTHIPLLALHNENKWINISLTEKEIEPYLS